MLAQFENTFLLNPDMELINKRRHRGRDDISITEKSWYETTELVRAIYQKGQYQYRFMFPDTNALFVIPFSVGGTAAVSISDASLGCVFDPRSIVFGKHDLGQLSRWNSYTVDSIWIFFQYTRFNPDVSLVDTLEITTFDKSAIQKGFDGLYAGAVNYDYLKNTAFGANVKKYSIPLTVADTGSGGKDISLAVNQFIASGASGENWFGAALSYKPAYNGYNHKLPFDTVADFTNTNIKDSNFVNTIRILTYQDESKFREDDSIPPLNIFGTRILNHGIVAAKAQRYRIPTNNGSILDYYSPGFYQNYHLFPVIDVHLKTDNLKTFQTKLLPLGKESLEQGEKIELKGNATLMRLYSISGQLIRGFENQSEFNSAGINKGIYVLHLVIDGEMYQTKLLIY